MELPDEVKIQLVSESQNRQDLGFSGKVRNKIARKLLRSSNLSKAQLNFLKNASNLTNHYGKVKSNKTFSLKGRRPKPNNMRNRTPGPGAYPIYSDFTKHPQTKNQGWIFSKAEKKISRSTKKAKFFGASQQRTRYNKNILGEDGPSPGPGAYNVFNSGIGSGFGAPPLLKKKLNRTFDSYSQDNRQKRRDLLYNNLRLRKIKGVSIGKSKRKQLSNVDPDVEVGPADYTIKSTIAQLQPWEIAHNNKNVFQQNAKH